MLGKTLDRELIVDAKFEDISGTAVVKCFRNTKQDEVQSSKNKKQDDFWGENPLLEKISFVGVLVGLYYPIAQLAFPEYAGSIYSIGFSGAVIGTAGSLHLWYREIRKEFGKSISTEPGIAEENFNFHQPIRRGHNGRIFDFR